jgi:hypothetical protein
MTLKDNVKTDHTKKGSGGQTIFRKHQEEKLCERLLYISDRGFPMTISESVVFLYAKKLSRRKKLQQSLQRIGLKMKALLTIGSTIKRDFLSCQLELQKAYRRLGQKLSTKRE